MSKKPAFLSIGLSLVLAHLGGSLDAAIAGDLSAEPPVAKTTVLLRLKSSLNGRPADLWSNFLYGMAHVETGEVMRPVTPISVSEQDTNGKWIYFALFSGTYHFWLIPPRTDLKRYRFQFVVPSGQPVLYIGSIEFNCWSKSA